ncbi:hypothetical protein PINS_up006043 [Pythium insidiosum]|nr:hypothetical protein PINS_up006043 [Pythium insidiosum]
MEETEMSPYEMEWRLRNAAWRGDVKTVKKLLIKGGININARDPLDGLTALHRAVSNEHLELVQVLLVAGADIEAPGPNAQTALHQATLMDSVAMATLLIDAGADVNASTLDSAAPLHIAARRGNEKMLALLASKGADKSKRNNQGQTPLVVLINEHRQNYEMLMIAWRLLNHPDDEIDSITKTTLNTVWGRRTLDALKVCTNQWEEDAAAGRKPTKIPVEVLRGGSYSVQKYIRELMKPGRPHYRHKICVIGPTTWGKTSLVKSLAQSECVLEPLETRTVGIELLSWHFLRERPRERHKVLFWDLAGQDVYHNVHRVFFSPRTLFLMVIDLKAYADALSSDGMRGSSVDDRMTRFFDKFILPWLSMVYTRLPDAHVVFVGTKRDLVTNVEEIMFDFESRIAGWLKGRIHRADSELRGESCQAKIEYRLEMAIRSMIVMSNNEKKSVEDASGALRAAIMEHGQGFVMPKKYAQVSTFVFERRKQKRSSLGKKISDLILEKNVALDTICSRCGPLTGSDCRIIMKTLSELGDVLWYADDHPAEAMRSMVCFSPTLVVNFIREIISHELMCLMNESEPDSLFGTNEFPPALKQRKEAYELIRSHTEFREWMRKLQDAGQVDARLLKMLPLWKELANVRDGEPFVALKQLLQHLGLAYPVGRNEITAESDLIIPAYWQMNEDNKNKPSDRNDNQVEQTMAPANHSWGYKFEIYTPSVPKILFEEIAVRSWRPEFTRVVPSPKRVVDTSPSGGQVEITLTESSIETVIRVTAVAATPDFAQELAFHHYEVVASVLTEYHGLDVSARSFDAEGYEEELDRESDDDRICCDVDGYENKVKDGVISRMEESDSESVDARGFSLAPVSARVKISENLLKVSRNGLRCAVKWLTGRSPHDVFPEAESYIDRAKWLSRTFDRDLCIALQALFEVGETIESLLNGVKLEEFAWKASINACWDCWRRWKIDKRREFELGPDANIQHAMSQYAHFGGQPESRSRE